MRGRGGGETVDFGCSPGPSGDVLRHSARRFTLSREAGGQQIGDVGSPHPIAAYGTESYIFQGVNHSELPRRPLRETLRCPKPSHISTVAPKPRFANFENCAKKGETFPMVVRCDHSTRRRNKVANLRLEVPPNACRSGSHVHSERGSGAFFCAVPYGD